MAAKCFICAQVYNKEERRPRQLPCGHSLCTLCAPKLLKENEAKCYVCRVSLKGSDATELPIDFVLDALVEEPSASKEQILCSQCVDPADPAEHFCRECGYLCADHYKPHSKTKSLKSHVVQAFKDLNPTHVLQQIVGCAKHHRPLEIFCQACRVVVCLQCCVFEHDGHKRIEASALSALVQSNRFDVVQESIKKKTELEAGINEIKTMENRVKAKCQRIEQQFTSEFDELDAAADLIKDNIRVRRQAHTNCILNIRNQKLKMLENQREGIETATDALNKCKEQVATNANNGMHIQTGAKAQYLATVIKSVHDRKLDLKPYAEAHDIIEYEAPVDIIKELKAFPQKLEQYGKIEDVDLKVQAERQRIEEQRKAQAEIERLRREEQERTKRLQEEVQRRQQEEERAQKLKRDQEEAQRREQEQAQRRQQEEAQRKQQEQERERLSKLKCKNTIAGNKQCGAAYGSTSTCQHHLCGCGKKDINAPGCQTGSHIFT